MASADYTNNVNQSDWSGGSDTGAAVTVDTKDGWNKYYSKSNGMNAGSNLSSSSQSSGASIDFTDESDYILENSATLTTLTPSATSGSITLTLGSGNWNDIAKAKKGTRVIGNGGVATISADATASSTISATTTTPFTSTDAIVSGSWQLVGTNIDGSLNLSQTAASLDAWTQRTLDSSNYYQEVYSIIYDSINSKYIAVGYSSNGADYDTVAWESSNLTNWTRRNIDIGAGTQTGYAIIYDSINSKYIVAGTDTDVAGSTSDGDAVIWESADLIAWTQRDVDTGLQSQGINSIIYDSINSKYIVAGGDTDVSSSTSNADAVAWESTDLINWTQRDVDTTINSQSIKSIIYDAVNAKYVAAGGDYNVSGSSATDAVVWESANLISWTQRNVDISLLAQQGQSIIYDSVNSKYVVAGIGQVGSEYDVFVWESADLSSWTKRSVATGATQQFAYSIMHDSVNNKYIVSGYNNNGVDDDAVVWESDNLTNWTQGNIDTGSGVQHNNATIYDSVNSKYIAAGSDDNVSGSSGFDAVIWEASLNGTFSSGSSYYVTTSDTSQLNTSAWGEIGSVSLAQITPTNTSIKYLVSFDDRTTWKYWNGSDWAVSTLDDLQTDGMSKEALEGLSSANWSATGGFVVGSTNSLDFAMDLYSTDDSVSPSLDQISLNYNVPTQEELISSKFDSGSDKNSMGGISWVENATLPSGSQVSLALRTASSEAGIDSASWSTIGTSTSSSLSSGCSKSSGTVTCGISAIPISLKTGGDDRWFQYKISITSGVTSPTITNINPIYEQDIIPPSIISITSSTANGEYGEGDDINITLNFSEPVTSTTGLSVSLNNGGVVNIPSWGIAGVSISGTYTVESGQNNDDLSVSGIVGGIIDSPPNGYANTTTNPDHTANNLATSANIIIDTVVPVSVVTIPNGTTEEYSQISISGTASDSNTLNKVEISIQDTDTGEFWIGSEWGGEIWLLATGTTSWNYNSAINWTVDHHFTVKSRATDQAGNIETPGAGKSFIFVNSPPTVTVNSVIKVNGNVAVNYDISDIESASAAVSLVYDSGATLSNGLDALSTASIEVSDTSKFPASGIILLENNSSATPRYEYITYSNVNGNYLEGITRATNGTLAYTHDSGIAVRTKANALSGDTGIVNNGEDKTLIWNSSADTNFNNNTQTVSVVADDGSSANEIGIGTSENFVFDTTVPVISLAKLEAINTPAELTFNVTDNDTIQMMISLNSDFSGASWENYSANETISLETNPDTVYVKFKDSQENITATQELTVPESPQSLMIQDVSSIEQNKWRLYISWQIISDPSSGFEAYRIYRSTSADGTYQYQGSTASEDISVDYYADTVNENDSYYYKVAAEDKNGNISYISDYVRGNANATQDAGEGGGGVSGDITAPVITVGPTLENITSNAATISWTTEEASDSFIEYGLDENYGSVYGDPNLGTTHSISLPESLNSSTTYHFRIRTRDAAGNLTLSGDGTFSTEEGEDSISPLISNVSVENLGATSVTIIWDTDENADSVVGYSIDQNYSQEKGEADLTQNHSIDIVGLIPEATYYFQIKSRDAAGNLKTETNVSAYTFTTLAGEPAGDTIAPSISNIVVSDLTYKTATIDWTTDENSNSLVDYGITNDFGESYGNQGASTTSHTVTIPNLKALTTYYFKVSSHDISSNMSSEDTSNGSNPLSFTTPSAAVDADSNGVGDQLADISNDVKNLINSYDYTEQDIQTSLADLYSITSDGPSIDIGKDNVATVTWNTNKLSDGKVVYWQDGNNEDTPSSASETGEMKTKHEVAIKNLSAQTEYSYYVISKTLLGSEFRSSTKKFSAGTAPSISGINVGDITLDGATISWVANSIEKSQVQYGTSPRYDEEALPDSGSAQTGYVTRLKGLKEGQSYHFRIKGIDMDGEQITSNDYSFITLELPVISKVSAKNISSEKVTIVWETNSKTDSSVEYKPQGYDSGASLGKLEAVTNHEVIIEDLVPGTAYEYKVSSKDQFGNSSESEFKTFFTPDDSSPPVIRAIKSEATVFPNKETKIQTIISWSTDKPTNSMIAYKEGHVNDSSEIDEKIKSGTAEGYDGWKIQEKEDNSFNHMFVFTDFNPASVYYFKVVSVDKRGNISISDNYSLITPMKKKSVFDLIVSNFEDTFGWVKKVGR